MHHNVNEWHAASLFPVWPVSGGSIFICNCNFRLFYLAVLCDSFYWKQRSVVFLSVWYSSFFQSYAHLNSTVLPSHPALVNIFDSLIGRLGSWNNALHAAKCHLVTLILFPLVLLQRSCPRAVKCTRYTETGTDTPSSLCRGSAWQGWAILQVEIFDLLLYYAGHQISYSCSYLSNLLKC